MMQNKASKTLTSILTALSLLPFAGAASAIDLRQLKELAPPAKVAKWKQTAKVRGDALLKKKRPELEKKGQALRKKLSGKLGI